MQKAIVGHSNAIEEVLVAVLAGGHCLIESVPGMGKTTLVKAIADVLDLTFNRIQFTPDLMPSDILGQDIFQEEKRTGQRYLQFMKGPVFANILLADEINRTPPKTQAALLEVMQEETVSIGRNVHAVELPFIVLATMNDREQAFSPWHKTHAISCARKTPKLKRLQLELHLLKTDFSKLTGSGNVKIRYLYFI